MQPSCLLWARSGHSNRSALAKRRTPGRGALIVKRLRGHSRSLPLPALAEQAGCGETANQPQKMYPYVMRLTLNHDGCDKCVNRAKDSPQQLKETSHAHPVR